MPFSYILGVDEGYNIPASVRETIADSSQMRDTYAHLDGGVLTIGDDPVDIDPSPLAGLDTVGFAKAVFIEEGGTVPGGTPPYTIVIELPA